MFGNGKIEIINNDDKDFTLKVEGNKPTVELMVGMLILNLLKNGFDLSDFELLLKASDVMIKKENEKSIEELFDEKEKEEIIKEILKK